MEYLMATERPVTLECVLFLFVFLIAGTQSCASDNCARAVLDTGPGAVVSDSRDRHDEAMRGLVAGQSGGWLAPNCLTQYPGGTSLPGAAPRAAGVVLPAR